MDEDPRFATKLKDPKFKRIPKNEKKVKIDKRFKSMFENQKFQVKYTIDKRGRPYNHTSKEDLKRYYALSSDESSDEADEDNSITLDPSDKSVPEHVKRKLKNLSVDYARGESALLSESSSDDDEESVADEEEFEHAWGELDRDAERTEEVTHRLAACNMDWDRIKAVDLMMVLSSFLPTGGVIRSVTIYPSEFGLKRMQEEEMKGPLELVELQPMDEDGDEGSKFHMEKLRKYQLNRLRYYYAVIVCDSKQTASKLYSDCDGVEYESSSTKLDLRFIPDEETFEAEPKEVCEKLPEQGKYQPRYFTTTALQQAKVDLTWDETDPDRIEVAEKLAKAKEFDNLNLQAYLASSSDGEAVEDVLPKKEEDSDVKSKGSIIDQYKSLLQDIEDVENAKKQDVTMEISWGVGFKEKTEKLVKKKLEEKIEKTPFEQFLDKRKEKRKLRKQQAKKVSESSNEDDIPSDIDMNDPYFAEEFNKAEFKQKKAKPREVEAESDDEQGKAELELLLSDDDGKNHFSLQKIQEREAGVKSKKSKKKPVIEEKADDFEIDVADDRFSALYTSHHFNIDPSDSHYKKTKGIEAIISEKLRRRMENEEDSSQVLQKSEPGKSSEISVLVKSLKRKTEALGFNKKKKLKNNVK